MPLLPVSSVVVLNQKRRYDLLQILFTLQLHLEAMNYLVNLLQTQRLHVSWVDSRSRSCYSSSGSSQQLQPTSASLSNKRLAPRRRGSSRYSIMSFNLHSNQANLAGFTSWTHFLLQEMGMIKRHPPSMLVGPRTGWRAELQWRLTGGGSS